MAEIRLAAVESRFADIIWAHAPIASRELARVCEGELGWTRTTTYNVLRKLCDRGIFENDGGVVRARMSREDFFCTQGEELVEMAFSGSLPAFIAAFTRHRALRPEELDELQRMIDEAR